MQPEEVPKGVHPTLTGIYEWARGRYGRWSVSWLESKEPILKITSRDEAGNLRFVEILMHVESGLLSFCVSDYRSFEVHPKWYDEFRVLWELLGSECDFEKRVREDEKGWQTLHVSLSSDRGRVEVTRETGTFSTIDLAEPKSLDELGKIVGPGYRQRKRT